MRNWAPIALFCFNRPEHLQRTVDALMRCEGFDSSELHIYVDGPRGADDVSGVSAVREVVRRRLPGAKSVVIRDHNIGLARNIIDGVTETCSRSGRVIVIEDDLALDPRFLRFVNDALDRYEHQPNVMQVAGHMSEVPEFVGRRQAVALPWANCWGWGTWQRAWSHFDPNATGWEELGRDRELRFRFNLRGNYDYTTMLEKQMSGLLNSWGVRWYWSIFRASGLVIYPPFNLVDNIGFDGSGTHGRGWLRRFGQPTLDRSPDGALTFPAIAESKSDEVTSVLRALRSENGGRVGLLADAIKRTLWRMRLTGSAR